MRVILNFTCQSLSQTVNYFNGLGSNFLSLFMSAKFYEILPKVERSNANGTAAAVINKIIM